MNNEKIEQFHRDLAAICTRYDMQGFIGMWLHRSSDLFGYINAYNPLDEHTGAVCNAISDKLKEFTRAVAPSHPIGTIRVVDLGHSNT